MASPPILASVWLAKAGSQIAQLDEDVEQIVDTHGDEMVKDARRRVPVQSGRLKRSIKKSVKGSRGDVTVTLAAGGGEVDYAAYVEYGTVHTGPRPFIRPAVDRELPKLESDLADELVDTALGKV